MPTHICLQTRMQVHMYTSMGTRGKYFEYENTIKNVILEEEYVNSARD